MFEEIIPYVVFLIFVFSGKFCLILKLYVSWKFGRNLQYYLNVASCEDFRIVITLSYFFPNLFFLYYFF